MTPTGPGQGSRSQASVEAIRRSADRLTQLLRDAPDPGPVVPHNGDWTVRDLLAHLVSVTARYAPAQDKRWVERADQVAGLNDAEIEVLGDAPVPVLLQRLGAAVDDLRAGPAVDAADPVPYVGGTSVSPADLLGILLGEFVVHGGDLAAALGARWDVRPQDAAEVLASLAPIMPAWVDEDGARGLTATFEVRVRGYFTNRWRFTDGTLEVLPGGGGPVDVTISADPVALLLVSYRRMPLWKAIVTGRSRAWGRRGMLAFRTNSYFRAP